MEITAFYSGQPKPLEQCLCDETRNGKKNPRGNMSECVQCKPKMTIQYLHYKSYGRVDRKNHSLEQLTLEERAIGNQNE